MTFSFGSTPIYVDEGQTIRLRFKAPSAWNTTQTVTVQIGEQTTLWYIVTIPEDFAPDSFPFTDLEDVELNTMYTWADGTRAGEQLITVTGLSTSTEATVSLFSSYYSADVNNYALRIKRVSIGETTFGTWTIPGAGGIVVSNTDVIQPRLRSSQSEGQQTYISVSIGTRTERWNITTVVLPPNVPEPFPDFTDITNQPFNTRVYSEILRVTGLNAVAAVVLDNGALCGIATNDNFVTNDNGFDVLSEDGTTPVTFTSAPSSGTATITNGQYIQLAYDTGSAANFSITNLLSVGEGINLSDWVVTTGNFPSITPDNFSFPAVTDAPLDTLIASAIVPAAGITGLGATTSVEAQLISTNPGSNLLSSRVRVHKADGTITSLATFPIDVSNGDKLQIYTKSSPNINTGTNMIIKVGTRTISSWDIVSYAGSDTDANYTPPSNLTGEPRNKQVSSTSVNVTGINEPITIDADGNGVYKGKISIDFGPPLEGPVTFDPAVNTSFRVIVQSSDILSTQVTVNVTVGTGSSNTFAWSVTTWASEPIAPELKGTWYSKKNAQSYYDTTNSANVVVESKDDGMAIGTVLTILKQSLGPGRQNTGGVASWVSNTYGDLSGDRDSRYPGYIECDGRPLEKTVYVDLFAVIGTQYGESNAAGNTGTTHFKVPDFRNRKLAGTGRVDGNAGSSPFLPSPSALEPGNIGGWWYVDNVDVTTGDPTGTGQQNTPYQQWIGSGSDSDESVFFDIGTVRTVFNESIVEDVDFDVTGNVNATIGPLLNARVNTPAHSHYVVTAQTYPGLEALIPWNTRLLPWGSIDDDVMYGLGDGVWIDSDLGDEPWASDERRGAFATQWRDKIAQYSSQMDSVMSKFFQSNEGLTWVEKLEDLAKGLASATPNTQFSEAIGTDPANNAVAGEAWSASWTTETWWPHYVDNDVLAQLNVVSSWGGKIYPFNDLVNQAPSANANRNPGQSVDGGVLAGAVLDVSERNVRIESYTPQIMLEDLDASVEVHSHYLTTQVITSQDTDFSYGNTSGVGSGRSGIPNAGATINVGFTQQDVAVELNTGTFKFNESYKKPIPTVKFRPNSKVPLIENFHKVKYIIKAY
jgi:hypothetical protein